MKTIALLVASGRRQRSGLVLAAFVAAGAGGAAAVLLLGLSGWFITACGLAGAGALNYMLPSAAIRLLTIIRTGARHIERLSGHDVALRILADLRPTIFRALAAAPAEQAIGMAAGDATARLIGDVDEIEAEIIRSPAAFGAWAALGVGLVLTAILAGPGVAACLLLPLSVWIARRLRVTKAEQANAELQVSEAHLRGEFAALLAGLPELRAYGLEGWACARLDARSRTLTGLQRAGCESWSEPALLVAGGIAAILALTCAQDGALPIAAFAALAMLGATDALAVPLRMLHRRGQRGVAVGRLDGILAMAAPNRPTLAPSPKPFIAFEDQGVSARPGSIVGVEGPSGSGKTRLLETIMRLREAEGGGVKLDGLPIGQYDPRAVRACFALLAQDAPILSGTVRDNLRLANPTASEHAMWQALHDAALDERIERFPLRLDEWLGEDGMRLSGGERRRLCLARAYLSEAAWLLLDEPTEGLDGATERLVVSRLRTRLGKTGQGALIVSHRKAPLMICETILKLKRPGIDAPQSSVRPPHRNGVDRHRSAAKPSGGKENPALDHGPGVSIVSKEPDGGHIGESALLCRIYQAKTALKSVAGKPVNALSAWHL